MNDSRSVDTLLKYAFFPVALLLVLASQTYAYIQSLAQVHASTALAAGEQCTEPTQAVTKENPQKMLFISCGGFLD